MSIVVFPSLATAMTSENYQISHDTINFSGSDSSTSTNYRIDDTMGEVGTGFMHSASYFTGVGYRQLLVAEPSISFSISARSIDLGILSVYAVNSGSHTFSVTTNATGGYAVRVYEDGDLQLSEGDNIDDVVDGQVTAGSEEYGIRTSGSAGQYNATDTAITNGNILALNNVPATDEQTEVTYKASISEATEDGSYSHTVYFVVSGTF